jgi:hypothetical protein
MTYNVRGVGRSQGSSPWLGLGKDPEDFAAMEAATIQLLGEVKEVRRAVGRAFAHDDPRGLTTVIAADAMRLARTGLFLGFPRSRSRSHTSKRNPKHTPNLPSTHALPPALHTAPSLRHRSRRRPFRPTSIYCLTRSR